MRRGFGRYMVTMGAARRVGMWASVLSAGVCLGAGVGAGVARADSVTFAFTGAAQSWTVPAGVTQATFDLYGAQGDNQCTGAGEGAHVHGTIAVVPGETLQVLVGGQLGFNGGGMAVNWPGGGASDIRRGPGFGLTDRLLVAGGGGGGGNPDVGSSCQHSGDGLSGPGGASATAGVDGQAEGSAAGGGGGQPGTTNAGGGGGSGGSGGYFNGTSGGPGSLGQGGDGAVGALAGGGGGGGGGYYGGGGGGSGGGAINGTVLDAGGGGGGGGGSSFTGAATGATVTDGVRAGDGLVMVTYTLSSGGGGGGGTGGGGRAGSPSVQFAGSPKSTGNGVTFQLHCSAPAGASCHTTDTLTSTETLKGGQPIAVSAAHKPKQRKRTVVVGAKSVTISAGSSKTITITLNAQGHKLLNRVHKLPVTLTIKLTSAGKTTQAIKRKLTIKQQQKKQHGPIVSQLLLYQRGQPPAPG